MSELIQNLVQKARKAEALVEFWSQEQIDEMIRKFG